MNIEYLADRKDFLTELAELHFAEWGYMRPDQTVDDRVQGLSRCCQREEIPTVVIGSNRGVLVGSALLVEHDMSTRRDLSPWLAGVYVKPEFRQSGLATRLIERIEQEATALQVPQIFLYTDKEQDFYTKRGWRGLENTQYRGLEVTIMSKLLGRPTGRCS